MSKSKCQGCGAELTEESWSSTFCEECDLKTTETSENSDNRKQIKSDNGDKSSSMIETIKRFLGD